MACGIETPEYYHTEGGLKYKYHEISVDGEAPKIGDYLSVSMKWKTEEDSLFYETGCRGNPEGG